MRMAAISSTLAVAAFAASAPAASGAGGAGGACPNANAAPKSITIQAFSEAVECLIGERRDRAHRGSLHDNSDLDHMGASHAQSMVRHNCWSHECPGEPSYAQRLKRSGYIDGSGNFTFAESWAHGDSPRSVVAYMFSVKNFHDFLLSRKFEDLGVGCAWGNAYAGQADRGVATCVAETGARG
jgi:uncharacterized protein YkwD